MYRTLHAIDGIAHGSNAVLQYARTNGGFGPWRAGAWGWGFGILWALFWLLVLVALVGAVVYFLTHRTDSTRTDEALETLRERYARGEIGDEEFEERASRLGNTP